MRIVLVRVLLYWRGALVRGTIGHSRTPGISVIFLGRLLVPYIVVDAGCIGRVLSALWEGLCMGE